MSPKERTDYIKNYAAWEGEVYCSPSGLALYYAKLRGYKLEIILARVQGISEYICLVWIIFLVNYLYF